jgi:hypothetical protein
MRIVKRLVLTVAAALVGWVEGRMKSQSGKAMLGDAKRDVQACRMYFR